MYKSISYIVKYACVILIIKYRCRIRKKQKTWLLVPLVTFALLHFQTVSPYLEFTLIQCCLTRDIEIHQVLNFPVGKGRKGRQ